LKKIEAVHIKLTVVKIGNIHLLLADRRCCCNCNCNGPGGDTIDLIAQQLTITKGQDRTAGRQQQQVQIDWLITGN